MKHLFKLIVKILDKWKSSKILQLSKNNNNNSKRKASRNTLFLTLYRLKFIETTNTFQKQLSDKCIILQLSGNCIILLSNKLADVIVSNLELKSSLLCLKILK